MRGNTVAGTALINPGQTCQINLTVIEGILIRRAVIALAVQSIMGGTMNRLLFASPITTVSVSLNQLTSVSLNKLAAVSLIVATDMAFVLMAYALVVVIQN